jgi:hypothetical protein
MKAYSEYCAATMIRGLLAVVAGTGVLFIPELAPTILLLPFAGRDLDSLPGGVRDNR